VESNGNRKRPANSVRRRSRTRWSDAVRSFEKEDLAEAGIGALWKRRILYEIGRTPSLLERVGATSLPSVPAELSSAHIEALKDNLPWKPATFAIQFNALRRFLRWARNPIATKPGLWTLPEESTGRRRWLTPDQLARLYTAARGRERVLVALEGFNGLRRVEVLRLRLKDIDFGQQLLHVLGKGRNGGKWRTLPMSSETAKILRSIPIREDPNYRVFPLSRSGADMVLWRASQRADFPRQGLRVSHHDLRRTFGRLAHKAGMDLVQLKNLYGHTSLDQTVHYIGLDEDEMRVGLARLATFISPWLRNGSAHRRKQGAGAANQKPTYT
jgi:integrase